jgi:acetyl-CoA carboxylase biotin carboxyl carrier protein
MMEIKKIREILRLIHETDVEEIEVWDKEDRVRIRRTVTGNGHDLEIAPRLPERSAPPAPPAPPAEPAKAATRRAHTVTSPLVGTFYRAPSPGADPFVEVGGRVRKGQTLCIIEAMKLMNEIEAEVDGVVAEVLVENGQPVEYGQALFLIEPHSIA